MAKFWSGLQWFWANHVQKVLGTILAGSALFDLMSALDLYSTTLTQRIVLRAVIKPKEPQ